MESGLPRLPVRVGTLLAALLVLAVAPASADAFTLFRVDDPSDFIDQSPGDGKCDSDLGGCTLRAAVEEANAFPGNDGVIVPAGTFDLTLNAGGVLVIESNVAIVGAGARSTIIRQELAGAGDRVFDVQLDALRNAPTVTISDVTIANGRAHAGNGFFGGNIRSVGDLTIANSTVKAGAGDSAGAVANNGGALDIVNSTITGNTAPANPFEGGDATVLNFGNAGQPASLAVTNTTITDNTARLAAGIFSYNDAGNSVSVTNSTIVGNDSGDRGGGGGLYVGAGTATVVNSILTGNTALAAPLNCTVGPDASLTSLGGNLESGTDCGLTAAGDLQSADPLLGPLVDNGGGTDTHAIAPLSPALNAANAQACPATDQRGVARPQGAGCDIGAFELSGLASPPVVTPALPSVVTGAATAVGVDGATLAGTVDPAGIPAGYYFEYGTTTAYGSQTAPGTSSGSGPQPVSASVGGLQSNTTYHYRLVASNAAGGAAGADGTFTTAPLRIADLPPPVLGRVANAEPVGGRVFVCVDGERACLRALGARSSQIPKGSGFVPLEEARQIPVGSFLDTRDGTVRLATSTGSRPKTQLGRFSAGIFQMLQSRALSARGMTELQLKGSSFTRCRPRARVTRAGASQLSRRTIRRLRANARGRFRTRGRHSAATVRGTVWVTADRCDGTLTQVKRGKVAVRDFRRKRTITLRAGKSYLARVPR